MRLLWPLLESQAPREYTRALTAAKVGRLLAKPFLFALDGAERHACRGAGQYGSADASACAGEGQLPTARVGLILTWSRAYAYSAFAVHIRGAEYDPQTIFVRPLLTGAFAQGTRTGSTRWRSTRGTCSICSRGRATAKCACGRSPRAAASTARCSTRASCRDSP